MFIKKFPFRSRSKSSSQSTKPSIDRVTSSSSCAAHNEKIPEVTVSSPAIEMHERREGEEEDDDAKDYREFLEKAKRDAERKERETARNIMKARETNLSPWAGRM